MRTSIVHVDLERQDIAAHRRTGVAHHGRGGLIRRVVWAFVAPLFRWSPRHLYGWRNFLLRVFGAKIGRGVRIYPSVRVFAPWNLVLGNEVTLGWNAVIYDLAPITIGDRCMISQNTHLCAGNHDHHQPHLPFLNEPIVVEPDAWICADAFVGSGVTVGRLAVIGARAVVVKDVPERTVVVGNPARVVGTR